MRDNIQPRVHFDVGTIDPENKDKRDEMPAPCYDIAAEVRAGCALQKRTAEGRTG